MNPNQRTQPKLGWNSARIKDRGSYNPWTSDVAWAKKFNTQWKQAIELYNTHKDRIRPEEVDFMKTLMSTISLAEGGKMKYDPQDDTATMVRRGEGWVNPFAITGAGGRLFDKGVFGTNYEGRAWVPRTGQKVNQAEIYNHGALLEGIYNACLEAESDKIPFFDSDWVKGDKEKGPVGEEKKMLKKENKLFERRWEILGDAKSKLLVSKASDCEALTSV